MKHTTRHPWLTASLATHLLLAAALYVAGPVRVERKRTADVRAAVGASLRQAEAHAMRRRLHAMEEIKEALEQSAGVTARKPAASDPAARARELAAAIDEVRQKIRASDMARALRIPEAEALQRVKAENAQRPRPALPKDKPPEAVVAQLAAQAQAALAERRAQLQARRDGVAVERPDAGRLDALASGFGMITPGALTGSSLDMSSSAYDDTRGYGSFLAPPPVDAAGLRPGAGRVLGAGGPYASRVFLDTWYVIGPFEGRGRDSLDAVYPPEHGVDLDAVYYGKNDLPVRWSWQQGSYPMVPRPRAEHAVYYAYTEVTLDRDMDLWVWIGADDDSKMWFNDGLVWIGSQVDDKPWYRQPFYSMGTELAARNLTEGQRRLHFHKGRNTILFKLYNGMNLMFFSVVLSR